MKLLFHPSDLHIAKTVCQECGRKKHKKMRPHHLSGLLRGAVRPDICLINQGYLCVGISTRGGCHAPCTRAGQPCVGCRGPKVDMELEHAVGRVVRAFDPCIACATH